jgi:hypothetical protein
MLHHNLCRPLTRSRTCFILREAGAHDGLSAGGGRRIFQIVILPAGKALVDIDKLTYAVPQEGAAACSSVPTSSTSRMAWPRSRTS